MTIDREAFQRDLEAITNESGVSRGRLQDYWDAENKHVQVMRYKQGGPILLFRAFQSLFLQTVEHTNTMWNSKCAQTDLPFYKRNMIPKLVHCFHHLGASELAATHGYPLPALTILRNAFDNIVLVLGAMQGLADFYAIEGTNLGDPLPENESRMLRKKTENFIRQRITGTQSGLKPNTVKGLEILNNIFDFEVHSAQLSFATAAKWIQGDGSLPVDPQYDKLVADLYANRLCEVTWPLHRLLPLLQHSALVFPNKWAKQWRTIDKYLEDILREIAAHQKEKVSLAVVELVKAKFSYSDSSRYPLQGRGGGGREPQSANSAIRRQQME